MKYLTIVLISLFSLQLHSQITQIGDNTYSYDGIRYTDKGLGPVLQSNRVAHSHYQKWLKSSNRGGVGYALSGLGMTILGSSMISNTKNDVVYFLSGAPILGLGLVTAGIAVGSIGLVKLSKGKDDSLFHDALYLFNYTDTSFNFNEPTEEVSIELGYSQGRVGLFITF